ncbi:hypothetical protein [Bacillus pseudomycoides]|uniref:hypothetical protein n=1 Tax=Bacillus pseudomycoides TaxID=64104 RepID=UPI001FB3D240|nr:hypothetical protein [Bacillus pseudomycoides]
MKLVILEIYTKTKEYKAQIIKRNDKLYTIEVFRWTEEEGYEFWNPLTRNLSLIDSKEHAIELAYEHIRQYTSEK